MRRSRAAAERCGGQIIAAGDDCPGRHRLVKKLLRFVNKVIRRNLVSGRIRALVARVANAAAKRKARFGSILVGADHRIAQLLARDARESLELSIDVGAAGTLSVLILVPKGLTIRAMADKLAGA